MEFTTLGFAILFILLIYFWWSLSRKIAEVEAKLPGVGATGTPKCCDDLEKRIDNIVDYLRQQHKFNKAIDVAICALEKMALDQDFDSWENNKSNCGHDSGGERVPPPEPEPNF